MPSCVESGLKASFFIFDSKGEACSRNSRSFRTDSGSDVSSQKLFSLETASRSLEGLYSTWSTRLSDGVDRDMFGRVMTEISQISIAPLSSVETSHLSSLQNANREPLAFRGIWKICSPVAASQTLTVRSSPVVASH